MNTLGRVQTQTLEALREGVAVFGSDGRLRLGNPAFAEVWHLDPDIMAQAPHIEDLPQEVHRWCRRAKAGPISSG